MDEVEVDVGDVVERCARVELEVERIACLDLDLVARIADRCGRNIGMPSIVASPRFGTEGDGSIDADLVLGHVSSEDECRRQASIGALQRPRSTNVAPRITSSRPGPPLVHPWFALGPTAPRDDAIRGRWLPSPLTHRSDTGGDQGSPRAQPARQCAIVGTVPNVWRSP